MNKPLESMGRFKTVVIDPPWNLPRVGWATNGDNGLGINLPYSLMDLESIEQMPLSEVLDADAFVFCWTVNKFLPQTFGLLEQWGCLYWFTMPWVKNGGIQLPGGPQFNAEYCLVGRKGRPEFTEMGLTLPTIAARCPLRKAGRILTSCAA